MIFDSEVEKLNYFRKIEIQREKERQERLQRYRQERNQDLDKAILHLGLTQETIDFINEASEIRGCNILELLFKNDLIEGTYNFRITSRDPINHYYHREGIYIQKWSIDGDPDSFEGNICINLFENNEYLTCQFFIKGE